MTDYSWIIDTDHLELSAKRNGVEVPKKRKTMLS